MADSSTLFAGPSYLPEYQQWSRHHLIRRGVIEGGPKNTDLLMIADNLKHLDQVRAEVIVSNGY